VPAAVARIRPLIDEFVMVEDAEMIDAMLAAAQIPPVLRDAVFGS
jgi:hypothetical protein